MKKFFVLATGVLFSISVFAQSETKTPQQTARAFMQSGDFSNAVLVLNQALENDKNNLELRKDLALSYYLKRDYTKALEEVKKLIDREDADVVCFQLAGNVYKALEEVKECEKVYKKGLKYFPSSGPLYSEYGELLWSSKDMTAIDQWEKGIKVDPAFGGNYYNAALYYFYTKDKIWSLIYGEIFVNMESMSPRGAEMKKLLLQGYKDKLFADADLMKDQKTSSEFAKAVLGIIGKQSGLVTNGINAEVLTMIRTRFILDWYQQYASRFPFRLFDYQQQLLKAGMFEAYNQWLFGPVENLAAYDNWTKSHAPQFDSFTKFQKTRIFKMPTGQYYQVN